MMPDMSAVIDKLQSEVEFLALQQGDDRLQVVLLLGRDPQLLALHLGLDALGALVPDDLAELLGVVLGDAFLEADGQPVLLAGQLGLAGVQHLERDPALDQLVLEHVQDRVGALLAVGPDLHPLLPGPGDRRADVAEVEPLADFLSRLVQRVVDLLPVELGHDVERRICRHLTTPGRHGRLKPGTRLDSRPADVTSDLLAGPAGLACPSEFALAATSAILICAAARWRFPGGLPERPKGAVFKPVGYAFNGSNPLPATSSRNAP